ncbi:MAG: phage antirepressor N-terminal domain-containing protein [Cypionkella sp.]
MGQIITVEFRQDTLFAVERDDGVFVAIKPICDTLGIKWSGQLERIKRDAILAEGIRVMGIPSVGGVQETVVLKLELINGWLFGIDDSRVKDEETRQKVLAYKRECYQTLFQHFHGKHEAAPTPEFEEEPRESDSVKLRMISEARHIFGNKSAAELWFQFGMPRVPAMLHDPRQFTLFDYSTIKAATSEGEVA